MDFGLVGDPRKGQMLRSKHPRNTCLTTCVSIRREVVCEAAAQMRVHACSKCKGAGCYIIVLAFQMKEQLLVNYDFNGKRCTKPIVEIHEAFPNLKMVDFCRNLVLTTKNQFRKQPPLHRQVVCFVVNLVPAPQQLTYVNGLRLRLTPQIMTACRVPRRAGDFLW